MDLGPGLGFFECSTVLALAPGRIPRDRKVLMSILPKSSQNKGIGVQETRLGGTCHARVRKLCQTIASIDHRIPRGIVLPRPETGKRSYHKGQNSTKSKLVPGDNRRTSGDMRMEPRKTAKATGIPSIGYIPYKSNLGGLEGRFQGKGLDQQHDRSRGGGQKRTTLLIGRFRSRLRSPQQEAR